jgi:ribose transport system permease protein
MENTIDVRSKMKKGMNRITTTPEFTTVVVLLILVVVTTLMNNNFITTNNFRAMARGLSFTMIASIGVMLTILIGEIDVSVGSVAGFGAIMITFLATKFNVPLIPAFLITLVLCGLMGTVNGVLIVKYRLPPFVATIAMLYAARGLAMVITKGYPVYPLPDDMNKIGLMEPFGTSVAFISAVLLVVIAEFVLKKTVLGRRLYAIGDNKEVARLAGINVVRTKVLTFTVCGILAGFAGVLQGFQLQSGQPTIGTGWELTCIAACAIGGVSLLGGAGSIVGTFLGMWVMTVLNNALILCKVNAEWQNVVVGAIMVGAVLFDMLRRNRKTL